MDSNYATNKKDRRSVSGGHLHIVGGTVVSWMSKTQETAALSSCESEYIYISSGAQEVKFIQMLLAEIIYCVMPGIMLEDKTGAIFLLKNVLVGARTKHIDIRWHYIRQLRANNELDVEFVRSEDNESDICTKNLPVQLIVKFRDNIRNGTMRSRMLWDVIVKAVEKESVHCIQKEDVVNWVRDWMNHGTTIPELSGLVTESIPPPIQVYYVEFGDWSWSAEPG
jgi:hypothetical protein